MKRWIASQSARRCIATGTFLSLCFGCTTPWTDKKKTDFEIRQKEVHDIFAAEDHPRMVYEVASEVGLNPRQFESFGLVVNLAGTGGICNPSPQTDLVLGEIRANDIVDAQSLLDSMDTAMVKVLTEAPAGARKDQIVDAIVQISRECNATSLRNGVLMESRLQEIRVLGGSARRGAEKARSKGPIIHLPISFTGKPEVDYKNGIILGGTRLLDGRMIGIRIRESVTHVMTATAISKAINDRFFFFDGVKRRGVATAKDDGFVMLDLPQTYQWDPQHFVQAVLHVGFLEKKSGKRISHRASSHDAC